MKITKRWEATWIDALKGYQAADKEQAIDQNILNSFQVPLVGTWKLVKSDFIFRYVFILYRINLSQKN